MHIQPITNQPNFNGKLIIDKGIKKTVNKYITNKQLEPKFQEIAIIMQDKPYDLFVFPSKQNPDFYCVAANKTKKDAKNIKEYTVKIQSSIVLASIVDAAKDAIEMYEKFIKG